jgi:hypothetical protein
MKTMVDTFHCLNSNGMSGFSIRDAMRIDNFVRPGVRSLEI